MAKDGKLKNMYKLYKQNLLSLDATEEQVQFLLENYLDEDYIIGIHNTSKDYQPYFDTGIHNQTHMGKDTEDLSNTVMYSDNFAALMPYPNGDGKVRGNTAIILKIPKKVFTHEQGIFETLKDGKFGIPPQFIIGAFQKGKVITNEGYDKSYESDTAIKCEDTISFQDKKLHAEVFSKTHKPKRSLKEKFIGLMQKIKGKIGKRKEPKLLLTDGKKEDRQKQFFSRLEEGVPSLEEQKQFTAERAEQSDIEIIPGRDGSETEKQ